VDVRVTGEIYTWSLKAFISGAVDILVVLQLPSMVVYFVAMYLMGPTSQVYRGAARTKLNIFSKFHSSIAKMLLAEVAYRGLVNNFTGHLDDLVSVTPPLLLERLEDIFRGLLTKEEIMRLATVVFKTMDEDNTDEIRATDFIKACTDDGEMALSTLTRFFHTEASGRRFVLQRILDDTESRATTVARDFETRLFTPNESFDYPPIQTFTPSLPSYQEVVVRLTGRDEVGDEEQVTGEDPDHAEDIALNKCREQIASHEKELQRLWDHQKDTVETLMRRMQEVELHASGALGILREAVQAHEDRSSPPHLSLECPSLSPRTMDAATQASTPTARSSCSSQTPAVLRQHIQLWQQTRHSFLATRPPNKHAEEIEADTLQFEL